MTQERRGEHGRLNAVSPHGRAPKYGRRQLSEVTCTPALEAEPPSRGTTEYLLVRDDRWRATAIERRRRLLRRAHRRRLLVVASFASALAVCGVLAATAYSAGSFARAVLVDVRGVPQGAVAVGAAAKDNTSTGGAGEQSSAACWGKGDSRASSYVRDGRLVSSASVKLTGLSLLGGRITAERLTVAVEATATRNEAVAGRPKCSLVGLRLDGEDVALDQLPLEIEGVGVLSALETRVATEKGLAEVLVRGLRLRLSEDWGIVPAGSDVVAGTVAARADSGTARALLPKPTTSKPSGSTGQAGGLKGSSGGGQGASGGEKGSSGGQKGSSGGQKGSSDGGAAAGKSGAAYPASSYRPGRMDSPRIISMPSLSLGHAVFPVVGRFWYQNDWHAPRSSGRLHVGCDIFARKGTPLVAIQAGTVSRLLKLPLGGISLRLTNERGDYFYYAHMVRYAKGLREGQRVRKGQVIGFVGNTGNARTTPPHVHFEIHPGGGDPVNPYPYLELWRGGKVIVEKKPPESGPATVDHAVPAYLTGPAGDPSRRLRHSTPPAAVATPAQAREKLPEPLPAALPLTGAAVLATALLGNGAVRSARSTQDSWALRPEARWSPRKEG
jgi:murein DD-endopeptidase MepM/ murein hydrolase activator NlpD